MNGVKMIELDKNSVGKVYVDGDGIMFTCIGELSEDNEYDFVFERQDGRLDTFTVNGLYHIIQDKHSLLYNLVSEYTPPPSKDEVILTLVNIIKDYEHHIITSSITGLTQARTEARIKNALAAVTKLNIGDE